MSKYCYNKNFFEVIDTEEKAYWLGFLCADGSVLEQKRKSSGNTKTMVLEVSLCFDDVIHLEKLKESIDANIPIKERIVEFNGKMYKSVRLNVCCTKMCRDLCRLGCVPRKTFGMEFPSYNLVPQHLYRHFMRGLFDGDGSIYINNTTIGSKIIITFSGTQNTVDSFVRELISQGVLRTYPTITQDSRSNGVSTFIHSKDQIKDVLDYLYKDCSIYLDRKYKKYKDFYSDFDLLSDTRGIYKDKLTGKYIVTIYFNGEKKNLGRYDSLDEAVIARKNGEVEKMNYKIAHLNSNIQDCSAELSEEALQNIG